MEFPSSPPQPDAATGAGSAASSAPADQSSLSDLCHMLASATASEKPQHRQMMYKNAGRAASSMADPGERRRRALVEQKSRRFDALALARKLESNNDDGDSLDDEAEEAGGSEHGSEANSSMQLGSPRRTGRARRDQLMLSEWLSEVPADFESEFVAKMCPQGKRVLLVAARSVTKVFDRRGRCIARFQSDLPGGGQRIRKGLTVLDCVWDTCTYHALDVMHWRDLQLYDTETSLRFHFLETNVPETAPNLHLRSMTNRQPIAIVPAHCCTKDALASLFASQPPFPLDGVLFYHRQSLYTLGSTPLVGWLKPYMLTELFGLPCHPAFLAGVPAGYAGWRADMQLYEATRAQLTRDRRQQRAERRAELEQSVEMA